MRRSPPLPRRSPAGRRSPLLRALRGATRVKLVYLLGAGTLTADTLRDIATFADGIGVHQRMIVGADSASVPTTLVRDAHAAGLLVHVWTMRSEPVFLAKRYGGDPAAEVREFARLGVDGIFGDFPDVIAQGLGRR